MMDAGGFFFDFEPMRTASGPGSESTGERSRRRWRASCVGGARSGDSRRRTDVVGVSWDPYPVPSVAAVAASSVARHAIDATPARWRGGAGFSPLNRPSTTASSPRNDFVKNYQVHPTHWLISTQVLVPVGAGARPGSGLAHSAAALHAVIRCGRGEASVS